MTEVRWMREFSRNLAYALNDAGMGQNEFARECGFSKSMVSKYINGRCMPDIKSVLRMSYVLGCSIDDLIDFGEPVY